MTQYRWFHALVVLGALIVGPSVTAGDANAGKSLYPVCTACHGPTGLGNQAMNAPKLAGQEPWYLIKQMQLFQTDARGTAPGDMQGMQMGAMAKGPQLKGDEALANLASGFFAKANASTRSNGSPSSPACTASATAWGVC